MVPMVELNISEFWSMFHKITSQLEVGLAETRKRERERGERERERSKLKGC